MSPETPSTREPAPAPVPPPPRQLGIRSQVPLAPLTSLELGGPARWYVEAADDRTVRDALAWAREAELPAIVLGGGSNLVVADAGVDAVVVRLAQRGVEMEPAGRVTVAAGEPWDPFVERTVAAGLAGVECLSGIPGTAGATPIQNVGAYGQEVSDTVECVRLLDRESLEERVMEAGDCAFGYRASRFRSDPDRFVVLSVTFRLTPDGAPIVRYPELERAVAERGSTSDLATVRETVLGLRARKSMVLSPEDPNRRSAGSFFVNPVVSPEEARAVVARAVEAGVVDDPAEVPVFDAGNGGGNKKLSAGWLVDHAGFARGTRRGPVGVSSNHALALVHHGGGTAAELVGLAREVRRAVRERFGVTLRPEPVFLGFGSGDPLGPIG